VYYLFLKIMSILVYFGMPSLGLLAGVSRYMESDANGYTGWLAWPCVIAAAVSILQLVLFEVIHTAKAWNAIISSEVST